MEALRYIAATLFLCSLCAGAQGRWQVLWRDEFDGPHGALPDRSKWDFDLGGGGWGNRELQVYTKSTRNVFLDGRGHLVIRSLKSGDGEYTSARLKTQNRFETTLGKIEARIKLPYGQQGVWAATWMLGSNITGVGWPRCGEIDIVEQVAREPSTVHGTVHGPGYSGDKGIGGSFTLPGGRRFSDAFHIFSVVWDREQIKFLVDDKPYRNVTPIDLPSGAVWVFNRPFFIIINVAIGGYWPGDPDPETGMQQEMIVDYVRVSRRVGGD
jgi:beta-glucanase (GH16 family)